jgi:hypothetical protein
MSGQKAFYLLCLAEGASRQPRLSLGGNMKKTGILLLLLLLAMSAYAQQPDGSATVDTGDSDTPQGTVSTRAGFPIERMQTPTYADLYCAGFISKQLLPNANFVAGGLDTPFTTKFANGDMLYLSGSGYQAGQQYTILRELQDPNRYELFAGQHALVKAMGQPYAEMGRVRIVDARSKSAIAQIEFSCDAVDPGDIAVPYTDKAAVQFHPPLRFDRFLPGDSKLSARIVMARDFDSELGPGTKVYLNVGSDHGVKVGDYFRAVRSYTAVLKDPVDSLAFKAALAEDTQKRVPSVDAGMFTKNNGAMIHVADLPRRSVGEIVILSATPTTSTGMIVFALGDILIGDNVELDNQQ